MDPGAAVECLLTLRLVHAAIRKFEALGVAISDDAKHTMPVYIKPRLLVECATFRHTFRTIEFHTIFLGQYYPEIFSQISNHH